MTPLDLPLRVPMTTPEESVITKIRTMGQAIQQCAFMGGFDNDKHLSSKIGIDSGQWSRILGGTAHYPHEKWELLFDVCGNEIPLYWLAFRRGYELKHRENELERQLREEREARAKAEERLAYLENLMVKK